MIKSFKCKDTKSLFEQVRVLRFQAIQHSARSKLRLLNRVASLKDLAVIPSLRLEKLKGDRIGQWSIRINDQWRIIFKCENNQAYQVQIIDYH